MSGLSTCTVYLTDVNNLLAWYLLLNFINIEHLEFGNSSIQKWRSFGENLVRLEIETSFRVVLEAHLNFKWNEFQMEIVNVTNRQKWFIQNMIISNYSNWINWLN